MPPSSNPFDQFDKPATTGNPFDQFDKPAATGNPFDQFDEKPSQPVKNDGAGDTPSNNPLQDTLASGARGMIRGIIPAAAGLAGGAVGAAGGTAVGGPAGGIAGGLAGGFGGAIAAGKAQDVAGKWAGEHIPGVKAASEYLGLDEAQAAKDAAKHPVAQFAGSVLPYAMGAKPGLPSVKGALTGGAIGGGIQGAQEVLQGNTPDRNMAARVAIGAGLGAGLAGPRGAPGKPSETPAATTIPEAETPQSYATAGAEGFKAADHPPFDENFAKPQKPPVISGPQGTHAPAELPPDITYDSKPAELPPLSPGQDRAMTSVHSDKTIRQVGNLMKTLGEAPHPVPFEGMRYVVGSDGVVHWGDARMLDHPTLASLTGLESEGTSVKSGILTPQEFEAARGQFKTTDDFNDWLRADAIPANVNAPPGQTNPILSQQGQAKPIDEILPVQNNSLGAAASPPSVLTKEKAFAWGHELADYQKSMPRIANDLMHWLNDSPLINDPVALDRISGAVEGRNLGSLSPEEQALVKSRYQPVLDEAADIHGQLTAMGQRKLGMDAQEANDWTGYQPGGLSRLPKKYLSFFQKLVQGKDRLTGYEAGEILRQAPSMHETTYDTMVSNKTGERVPIEKATKYANALRKGDTRRWDMSGDGKTGNFKYGTPATGPDGEAWHLERGTGSEIEEAQGLKHGDVYSHNADQQAGVTLSTLRHKLAGAQIARRLVDDPDMGLKHVFGDRMPAQMQREGYKMLTFPGLQHYAARGRPYDIISDYSPKHHGPWWSAIANISHRLTQTVFWNVGHLYNTAQLSLQNTGWHALNPLRYPDSVRDLASAFKSVSSGGGRWAEWEKVPGANLEAMGVKNRVLMQKYQRVMADQMKADPAGSGMASFAKQLGLKPMELYNAYYGQIQKVMWNGSDVMSLWRLERNLKDVNSRMGRSPSDMAGAAEAVKMTVKDVPDYWMPDRLWEGPGGRAASQILRFTPLNVFGRYHYNVANGLMQIAKDFIGPNATPSERAMAAGKIVNLGVMMIGMHLADQIYKGITKDDKHELSRHGSLSTLQTYINIATGKAWTWGDLGRTVGLSEAPVLGVARDLMSLYDTQHGYNWAGMPILAPGDTIPHHLLQAIDQALTHFPPWQVMQQMRKSKNPYAALMDLSGFGMTSTKMDEDKANRMSPSGSHRTGTVESLFTGRPFDSKVDLTKRGRPMRLEK